MCGCGVVRKYTIIQKTFQYTIMKKDIPIYQYTQSVFGFHHCERLAKNVVVLMLVLCACSSHACEFTFFFAPTLVQILQLRE